MLDDRFASSIALNHTTISIISLFSLPLTALCPKCSQSYSSVCLSKCQALFLRESTSPVPIFEKLRDYKYVTTKKKQQWLQPLDNIETYKRLNGLRIFSKWKWWKKKEESILNNERPLPLPMTYPDSTPVSKEEVERMENCNPQTQDCKEVIYQWTGECRKCQGTGLVNFYRKNGHKVVSNCITCLGIGYVQNFTQKGSIDRMNEWDEPD